MTNKEYLFCVYYHSLCVENHHPIFFHSRLFADILFDEYYKNPKFKVFKKIYKEYGSESLKILDDNTKYCNQILLHEASK